MVINQIKKILEDNEFDCSLAVESKEIPFEKLLVDFGVDAKEREKVLEIISNPLPFPELNSDLVSSSSAVPYRIQFSSSLPFKIQDVALSQVASLILFLNQFIELPGFELNELEGQVIYRYVWINYPSSVDSPLLMSVIGSIMLNLSLFNDTIESLADGQVTFNDLLSQIVKIAENSSS